MNSNRDKKISILNEVKNDLKTYFVGLDSIIDEIITDISPWYITPEIIDRPVVISLWGMTGTGKSSLVKKLIELLDLKNRSIFFDCGEESNSAYSGSIVDKINDRYTYDYEGESKVCNDFLKTLVFVFDEFQYARTIDEDGNELNKAQLRPIWNLIDDGILNINEYKYVTSLIMNRLGWLEKIRTILPSIEIESGLIIKNPEHLDILRKYGIVPDDSLVRSSSFEKDNREELEPIELLNKEIWKAINNKFLFNDKDRELVENLNTSKNIEEVYTNLKKISKLMLSSKTIDCSSSLIFVLGNLDEAYTMGKTLSPDIDADTLNDMTNKVTVTTIKKSLKTRFRLEQISRFGNNLIKYPTLKKEHFEQIIDKEIDKICNRFLKNYNILLAVSDNFKKLIYSEGVTPSQGVRPLLSTIGTIFTPLLSDVILLGSSEDKVLIGLHNDNNIDEQFTKSSIDIDITVLDSSGLFKTSKTENKKLLLGELRDPNKCDSKYIRAVHEIGHAIIMSYTTGYLPTRIVAISSEGDGFCSTYIPTDSSIPSKHNIESDVMISMGGYISERIIYKDNKDLCLLGSSSDIKSAWNTLTSMSLRNGYFEEHPFSYTYRDIERNSSGISNGFSAKYLDNELFNEFNELYKEVRTILYNEKRLIVKASLYLGEKGKMSGAEFSEFINKYGEYLTLEHMEKVKIKYSSNIYKETLILLDSDNSKE